MMMPFNVHFFYALLLGSKVEVFFIKKTIFQIKFTNIR